VVASTITTGPASVTIGAASCTPESGQLGGLLSMHGMGFGVGVQLAPTNRSERRMTRMVFMVFSFTLPLREWVEVDRPELG